MINMKIKIKCLLNGQVPPTAGCAVAYNIGPWAYGQMTKLHGIPMKPGNKNQPLGEYQS